MFKSLRFVMRFGPRKADNISKQHLRELMAKSHALGELPPFTGEINAASAINFHKIVTREPLEGGGDRRWSDAKLFREARADRRLPFFEHFPNGFEIVFARDARLLLLHVFSDD